MFFLKKGVIKDVPEDMELENLMQRLNSDKHNKHPIAFQIIDAVRLTLRHLELKNCPLMFIFAI
jgi:hypothetical protein